MGIFFENSFLVFLILSVVIGGGAAWLSGRALAIGWRPIWQTIAYMVLLGIALRFFHFSLFQGTLLSLQYYLADLIVLCAAALLGYRMTRVRQMVTQYPWRYERAGALNWREKKTVEDMP